MLTTTHELTKLRTRAAAVLETDGVSPDLSARAAARCLSGVVRLMGIQCGETVMRQACADLAGFDAAWSASPLRDLPRDAITGAVAAPVLFLATAVRGILPLAGAENMRGALAFWACEDAAAWQAVAA